MNNERAIAVANFDPLPDPSLILTAPSFVLAKLCPDDDERLKRIEAMLVALSSATEG